MISDKELANKKITMQVITDFFARIGLENNFSIIKADNDFIRAVDADMDFDDLKLAVLNNRAIRNKIDDNGIGYIELHDTVYITGTKTDVSILVEKGANFGTYIKVIVKNVDYVINGELKRFNSFASLKKYVN